MTSIELHLVQRIYTIQIQDGSGNYQAQGLLNTSQTEIVSTRNGRVVTEQLSGERTINEKR